MNYEEYKADIYYEKQEQKNAELIGLTFTILIPACGIIAGLFVIWEQFRNLIKAI